MKRLDPAALPPRADLVVVGGGVTGAAAARDAALRGLSVVLLEREDFGAGTSSRSTKLVHGGLRYLRSRQFALVRESVRERELLLALAPHVTEIRPFIYLLYEGDPEGPRLLDAGLTLYDVFSGHPLKGRHRMLDAAGVLEREPHLDPRGLRGGGWYRDALTDDARLTLDTVRSAAEAGAHVANHAEVTGLLRHRGRVAGVVAEDRLGGGRFEVPARLVLNTAGPWVDAVRRLADPRADTLLGPTKGVHLVLRRSRFPLGHALFLRAPRDGRVVWPIPALDDDLVYVGTTDTPYDGPLDDVAADPDDVDYLLEVANRTLPDAGIGRADVVGTWAGLRPLVAAPAGTAASSVPREHVLRRDADGVLTIAGGKLTTARVMARQLVDAAVAILADEHGVRGVPASSTHEVPLAGGDEGGVFRARRALDGLGLAPAVAARWRRYGAAGLDLARRAAADPEAAAPLDGGSLTRAEIAHAIDAEMAMTVEDVLVRRTSRFFWSQDGGLGAAGAVVEALGAAHGRRAGRREREVDEYRRLVARNRP